MPQSRPCDYCGRVLSAATFEKADDLLQSHKKDHERGRMAAGSTAMIVRCEMCGWKKHAISAHHAANLRTLHALLGRHQAIAVVPFEVEP